MLNFLYEFLPVLFFFIFFKWQGIYAATVVGILVTAIQLLISYGYQKKVDKKQLITLLVFAIFGGMTLYFHNPIFIKWKPSVIFWLFAVILASSHFVGKKPIMQRMMETMLQGEHRVTNAIWRRISWAWIVFFAFLGTLNIYIAYHFSTETWVNFKIFGILSLLFIVSLIQAICLSRYMDVNNSS